MCGKVDCNVGRTLLTEIFFLEWNDKNDKIWL